MTDSETFPGVSHREAAGWVLGALDPHDVERFKGHLESCAQCQAAVTELERVTRLLKTAMPAALPSADLRARTLASVERASSAAGGGMCQHGGRCSSCRAGAVAGRSQGSS
jgi:anti-sigma factor RsiW